MFPIDTLFEFTKSELVRIIGFINTCASIHSEKNFLKHMEQFNSFFPHDHAICGLGQTKGEQLDNILKLIDINYPKNWISDYLESKKFGLMPIVQSNFINCSIQIWTNSPNRLSKSPPQFFYQTCEIDIDEDTKNRSIEDETKLGSIFSFSGRSVNPNPRTIAFLRTVTPHLHQALLRTLKSSSNMKNLPGKLSIREGEVLKWVKEGKTNWEISKILDISERTVKFHVSNIKKKLDAVNRGHAVAKAIENNIISV